MNERDEGAEGANALLGPVPRAGVRPRTGPRAGSGPAGALLLAVHRLLVHEVAAADGAAGARERRVLLDPRFDALRTLKPH
jgi:hypothetical protein